MLCREEMPASEYEAHYCMPREFVHQHRDGGGLAEEYRDLGDEED